MGKVFSSSTTGVGAPQRATRPFRKSPPSIKKLPSRSITAGSKLELVVVCGMSTPHFGCNSAANADQDATRPAVTVKALNIFI